MPQLELFQELDRINIQITPGATEILKNSNVPLSMLLQEIKKKWKGKTQAITVKDAIEIMLTSDRYAKISRKVQKELKTKVTEAITVPRIYRKTYYTLKRYNMPVTAGQVAQITHRKTNTERIYLNKLVEAGYLKKSSGKKKKTLYFILEPKK
jgi:Fic family protein